MKQDEIVKMAREVGLCRTQSNFDDWIDAGPSGLELEDFAKLVEDKVRDDIIEKNKPVLKRVNAYIKELQDAVKAEREECAKICDAINAVYTKPEDAAERVASQWCAERIRARGNT